MSKTIPPKCPEPETGPKYWRSLDQLADTPEFRQFVEREFPQGASDFSDPVSRRHFVKIMSASFLLAGVGLTGCRRPEEHILPFANQPENYIHGVPKFYATARPTRSGAIPLVAKANDGRPTKVEGNTMHPDSNGGTDVLTQASILNLYDVDRAMRITRNGASVRPEVAFEFLDSVARRFGESKGEGLCFLADRNNSPSRLRLKNEISKKFPQGRWFAHEPIDFDVHRQAAQAVFGADVAPYAQLDQARRIVSLDCDFIGSEGDAHRLIGGFTKGRKIEGPEDDLNRLYAVEALMSLTGANADHRLRIPSSAVLSVAAALAREIFRASGGGWSDALTSALGAIPAPAGVDPTWITECAKDLLAHKQGALVLVGYRQPLAVHVLAHAMNAALGAVGRTLKLQSVSPDAAGSLSELSGALNGGQVDTLVVLNDNPVYTAPADLDWAAVQRKAKTVIRLAYYEDETFGGCDWHFPATHYLESWGDARTSDGTLVSVQPLIAPLFGGMTELEFLARLGGLTQTNPYDIVRETFRSFVKAGGFEESWKKFLHDGFLDGSAAKTVSADFNGSKAAQILAETSAQSSPATDNLEVVFTRDSKVDDGRYNNNGWLQELPDPVTKMVWENVVLMSKATADALGLVIVDHENLKLYVPLVKVSLNGREVEGPAWIQPGMADNVIAFALGYGRSKTGRVGTGTGFNAYELRSSDALHVASGAKITAIGKQHQLATTQNHGSMEGRPIIREANLDQFRKHPDFAGLMNMHEPPGPRDKQGRPAPNYPNPLDIKDENGVSPRERAIHSWGMSIDLNSCVGCSACVVACQSENNVPIVGKDQVMRNREMHWIRIDRYYAGDLDAPSMVTQPMLCQHCESAPCENVCPVNATVHDAEGLNVMAYNRCVGTRYCSNNCPYKVRRFNYFDYNRRPLDKLAGPIYSMPLLNKTPDDKWELASWWENRDRGIRPDDEWELLKLVKNPDVTVRMRGVMEKCSFCLQRIEHAKIAQKVKAGASGDVEVPDGTIQTACQQACPADAIVFGNLKDPNSRVSQLKKQQRDYSVLEFLLTKPRTTYLARVRNPNPLMPDYHTNPYTLAEWEAQGNALEHHGTEGESHEEPAGVGDGTRGEEKGGH